MQDDEAERRPARAPVREGGQDVAIGQDLATLSVDEISERIALLEREIARLREAASRKVASRGAADAFFKSP